LPYYNVTAVPEVSITVAFKDTNPPGPSFLFNHMNIFNDIDHYVSLSDKWDIMAFMDRKTPGPGGADVMKYSSAGNSYNWKIMATLHPNNLVGKLAWNSAEICSEFCGTPRFFQFRTF
jgi:hypothetical protein